MARAPRLYGPDGQIVRRESLLRERAAPSLASVRQPWMIDAIADGITPSSVSAVLRSADAGETRDYYTLAQELEERHARYGAVLGVRRRAAMAVEPSVEAASDSAADVGLADEIRELARRPAFRQLLAQCLWGLGPGLAPVEILWDRSAGQWSPREYLWRDPRWFRWDREDASQLRVLADEDQAEGVPLEPGKWVAHCPRLRPGIPARGGLARPVAAFYCMAAWGLADWAGWLEHYGRPIRVGKWGSEASDEDKATLQRAVSLLGSDAAATMPESMSVELIEAARSSSSDAYERFERWLDEQVSIAVLGQAATTEGTPGRLGSDEAQAEVRADILAGDCEELAETLNRDLVRPYIDLNRGPQAGGYPRIVLKPENPEDAEALARTLRLLVPLGMRVEASVVRDRLGWPDPPAGAEVLGPPASGSPPSEPSARASVAASARAEARQSLLEELEERALDGWQPAIEPLLRPLRELAERAATPEEFEAGLAGALAEMDENSGPLREALAAATFAARGLGDDRDEP